MKKILTLLMVASIFSLVACGPSEEDKAKAEADAAALVDEMTQGLEDVADDATEEMADADLPEHVCDAKCEEEGCTGARCGEKGHVCTDACKAMEEATEETPTEEATEEAPAE